ncbi:MAG: hypothetical protein GX988_01740 [Clostridiales bacterium]|nr:hypothetical protein [Clostridiales bacterium]
MFGIIFPILCCCNNRRRCRCCEPDRNICRPRKYCQQQANRNPCNHNPCNRNRERCR